MEDDLKKEHGTRNMQKISTGKLLEEQASDLLLRGEVAREMAKNVMVNNLEAKTFFDFSGIDPAAVSRVAEPMVPEDALRDHWQAFACKEHHAIFNYPDEGGGPAWRRPPRREEYFLQPREAASDVRALPRRRQAQLRPR